MADKNGFRRFRKRPIIVRAKRMQIAFSVETKEGIMWGKAGDFLVIGIDGEKYPVDNAIFYKTYEAAD